jgi:hypothetical protein
MHQHECNTHIEPIYFYSENQTMNFSYTIFPVNKINVEKIYKLRANHCLIILSIHIPRFEERINKGKEDKQEYCY